MSINPFEGRATTEGAPYDNCLTVAPSDTADLPVIPSAIYLPWVMNPTTGAIIQSPITPYHLSMIMQNGEELHIFSAGVAGDYRPILLPLRPMRIKATGTEAKAITLLW